jgi:hypothetical protein
MLFWIKEFRVVVGNCSLIIHENFYILHKAQAELTTANLISSDMQL